MYGEVAGDRSKPAANPSLQTRSWVAQKHCSVSSWRLWSPPGCELGVYEGSHLCCPPLITGLLLAEDSEWGDTGHGPPSTAESCLSTSRERWCRDVLRAEWKEV